LGANKKYNSILTYSSLAFQMIGVLLLCTWLGQKGDDYFEFKTPWLTIVGILLGLFGIMYKLIRDFAKK